MVRHKKIPTRMPPLTKEISELLKQLVVRLGDIAALEKDSIRLANARQALVAEEEPKKKEAQPELSTSQPKRSRKKKIDLDTLPPDRPTTEASPEPDQEASPEPDQEASPEPEPEASPEPEPEASPEPEPEASPEPSKQSKKKTNKG